MTDQIEQAMQQEIENLDWMSPATKQAAIAKLHIVQNKIGYPDKWRDYSSLTIERNDYFGNVERAHVFNDKRDWAKVGKPVDRNEWFMSPPTVNAYYDPQMNNINFPAGVLQPPLYDPKEDDAPNYGDTGGTIGHELTHGFDDEGRQFDGQGNLRDWWTPADARGFEDHINCLREQFAGYIIVDDIHINSKLTSGEDTPTSAAPCSPISPGRSKLPGCISNRRTASRPISASSSAWVNGPVKTSAPRTYASAPCSTRTRLTSTGSTASSPICRSSPRPSAAKRASPW